MKWFSYWTDYWFAVKDPLRSKWSNHFRKVSFLPTSRNTILDMRRNVFAACFKICSCNDVHFLRHEEGHLVVFGYNVVVLFVFIRPRAKWELCRVGLFDDCAVRHEDEAWSTFSACLTEATRNLHSEAWKVLLRMFSGAGSTLMDVIWPLGE